MAEQERRLCFDRFDNAAAWKLGTRVRTLCESRRLALAIEVRLMRETVFCRVAGRAGWQQDRRHCRLGN
jgi:uncharacterized protein (UPF0303 family)